ncbi:competence type IV pilus minor pilin ComGD [Streptococcus thoraltensis]|uniref:competence type IV pilus minor pilin ComGD n=1 Tax=Streptococcus thoraltensis TaxID=55085 RepID=UPI001F5A8817|nr:competence type IV pilus minor pilin ComGD [Streptococcus thoraltensis]
MPKLNTKKLKAFTLIEALLTLSVVTFLALTTSGSIKSIFNQVQTKLFFIEFEQVYRETQRLSASQGKQAVLRIGSNYVENPLGHYVIPNTIVPEKEQEIVFNKAGGNSSLAKVVFKTPGERVTYQLYLGSGQYQKKKD